MGKKRMIGTRFGLRKGPRARELQRQDACQARRRILSTRPGGRIKPATITASVREAISGGKG